MLLLARLERASKQSCRDLLSKSWMFRMTIWGIWDLQEAQKLDQNSDCVNTLATAHLKTSLCLLEKPKNNNMLSMRRNLKILF